MIFFSSLRAVLNRKCLSSEEARWHSDLLQSRGIQFPPIGKALQHLSFMTIAPTFVC